MGKTKEQIEQEEFEEVTHSGFLVLFFIVATIVIGALCFIAGMVYSSYLNRDEERYEEKINNDEEEKKEISNEKLVEDEEIIEKLDKKKEIIINSTQRELLYNFFKKDVSVKEISKDDKLKLALSLVTKKNDEKYTKEEILEKISDKEKDTLLDYNGEYIDVEDLEKEYYEFWGENIKNHKTQQLSFRYVYIKDLNIYLLIPNSGESLVLDKVLSYDYTVTEDDYNYYLYTAFGVISPVGNVYNDLSTYYSEDNKDLTPFDKNDNYEIDKDNYEEFSKYKITFKKAPKNKMFFSKIERVQ